MAEGRAPQPQKRSAKKLKGEIAKIMKKLVSATALALTLALGAGSVLAAQSTNTSGGGTTTTTTKKRHRKHHRKARRHHARKAKAAANTNTNS